MYYEIVYKDEREIVQSFDVESFGSVGKCVEHVIREIERKILPPSIIAQMIESIRIIVIY